MQIRTLVAALREARRYPHAVERVETIETHISFVLLAGEHAYKLKKPLDLGFLDYGTLAKRRAACEEELRLNRRTAPELYLGLVSIRGTPQDPHIGPASSEPRSSDSDSSEAGPVLEYAVHMRRFPQEDLASQRVAGARLTTAELELFAADLARFHAAVEVAGPESPFGSPAAVLTPALDNCAVLARAPALQGEGERLAELGAWTEREGARLAPLFAARQRAGRVRECHGDLHLGNLVFLAGRAVPFDCIEFAPALRWIDVLCEVAFLAMDLLDDGEPALAHAFLDAYLEAAGEREGLAALAFYLVYRALVRAKVAALRAEAADAPAHARARAAAEARGYLALAERLTHPRPRALLLMHGLSGSGKTRIAARIVARTGALRLRSDVERKRLFGLEPGARSHAGLGRALYAPAASAATYARLEELAAAVLAGGFAVVVDATSLRRTQRDAFRALARAQGVPFALISCRAAPAELRRRVAEREALGHDPSEAGVAVLEAQLRDEQPLADDERAEALVLDTEAAPGRLEDELEGLLRRLGLAPPAS